MNLIIISIFHLALACSPHFFINAWVITEPVQYDDGKCVLTDGTEVDVDTPWYDDEVCVKYECAFDNYGENDFVKFTFGCEEVSVHNTNPATRCELETPPGDYPDCCPRPVCNPTK